VDSRGAIGPYAGRHDHRRRLPGVCRSSAGACAFTGRRAERDRDPEADSYNDDSGFVTRLRSESD